jgi:hypothetical protein
MKPFQPEECNSMPIRPPTRKLSNNFYVEEEEQEVEVIKAERCLPVRRNSISSNYSSNHTRLTASESESDDCESRRIRFSMTVKKHLVESCRSFSEKERSNCWYSTEEKTKRNSKVAKLVDRMNAGKPEKRSRPYRGLYSRTDKGTADFNLQIARTLNAVLDEQDRQWEADVTEEVRIASICRNVTAVMAEQALHIAYQDELEAAAIQGSHCGS